MHLTRQLLGFGRQRVVAREMLSLNGVVEGMERMLRPLLGEDITLVTHLSPGLGGVEADYGQMEQVVMNLTLNARDAMTQGGRLTIETMDLEFPEGYAYRQFGVEVPAGAYVLLIVSDTGQGMTPEVKAHLFEPFFTTKPTTLNTGLGLATVYGIVIQSGGYIWVDTRAGEGCSFKICFPRVAGRRGLGRGVPRPPRLTARAPKPCCWSRTRTRSGRWRHACWPNRDMPCSRPGTAARRSASLTAPITASTSC